MGEKAYKYRDRIISFLSFVGIIISSYLAYVYVFKVPCETCSWVGVRDWAYSKFFGFSTPILGLLMYTALLILSLSTKRYNPKVIFSLILGISTLGVIISASLTYIELFIIKAICPWCMASALTITIIFVFAFLTSPLEYL